MVQFCWFLLMNVILFTSLNRATKYELFLLIPAANLLFAYVVLFRPYQKSLKEKGEAYRKKPSVFDYSESNIQATAPEWAIVKRLLSFPINSWTPRAIQQPDGSVWYTPLESVTTTPSGAICRIVYESEHYSISTWGGRGSASRHKIDVYSDDELLLTAIERYSDMGNDNYKPGTWGKALFDLHERISKSPNVTTPLNWQNKQAEKAYQAKQKEEADKLAREKQQKVDEALRRLE